MKSDTRRHFRRASLLGIVAWSSTALIAVSMYPGLSERLNNFWLVSGLFGLVSAVGLSEVVKRELAEHEQELNAVLAEAQTDALTGLANRRLLDRHLVRIEEQASMSARPVSLVVIDVDHFKELNDRHGHQAGDAVLRMISRCLLDGRQPDDLAARYGGEEFALLLRGADAAAAMKCAESIRRRVEACMCRFRGNELRATVSIGVAQWATADTADTLFLRADEALYAAKNAGRNDVFVHSGHTARSIAAAKPVAV